MTYEEFCDLTIDQKRTVIQEAMWDEDLETLRFVECGCCCSEHTFSSCLARIVNGCRGQGSELYDDETWRKQYPHLTDAQFYGRDEQ